MEEIGFWIAFVKDISDDKSKRKDLWNKIKSQLRRAYNRKLLIALLGSQQVVG